MTTKSRTYVIHERLRSHPYAKVSIVTSAKGLEVWAEDFGKRCDARLRAQIKGEFSENPPKAYAVYLSSIRKGVNWPETGIAHSIKRLAELTEDIGLPLEIFEKKTASRNLVTMKPVSKIQQGDRS